MILSYGSALLSRWLGSFVVCSPVAAAEDGAGRGLHTTELAGVGHVGALGDEGLEVRDVHGLLDLMLPETWEE